MMDLVRKLLDLKALLGSAYFADLQAIALAALARDWKQVVHLSFVLAEKVATEHLFPTPVMTAAPVSEGELDATLKELETGTVVTVTGAEAVAISPGEIIAIVTLIADLVKLWRDRKKA